MRSRKIQIQVEKQECSKIALLQIFGSGDTPDYKHMIHR
jgi:hypothetical protein